MKDAAISVLSFMLFAWHHHELRIYQARFPAKFANFIDYNLGTRDAFGFYFNLYVFWQVYTISGQHIFWIQLKFALKGFIYPAARHGPAKDVGQVAHDLFAGMKCGDPVNQLEILALFALRWFFARTGIFRPVISYLAASAAVFIR